MATKPKLIVIGYTNIDINITPSSRTVLPGGAAYFASCAASLYTKNIGLVTRVGYDFDPAFLLTRVLPEGVHRIADKQTAKSTQTYHSETDPTKRDVLLEKGVAQDLCPSDIPEVWLKSATHIHVGTMPPEYQKKFIDYLKTQNLPACISSDTELSFIRDPALKPGIIENLNKCDLVFVNRAEYELLKNDLQNVRRMIIKYDKDGAVYFEDGTEKGRIGTSKVYVVDATGAGDVFAGVFLACQSEGKSIPESLKAAAKTATKSIEQKGILHLFK